MQAAFLACDAYQCGYCTSGQIMSAVALLKEPCGPDDADVKELMSGNICRCGAYPNIVAAIQRVRQNAKPQKATCKLSNSRAPNDSCAGHRGRGEGEDCATGRGHSLHRRRHDADRSDEAERRDSRKSWSTSTRLPLDKIEALPDGGLTIGAMVRNSDLAHHPSVRKKLRRSFRSDFERRVGAASQHGDHGRQSAAAHALHVFPRHRDAVQQARAWLGLRGDHRSKSQSGHSRTSEHCIATNPSDMNVALAALEATIHIRGTKGRAQHSDRRFSSASGEHAAA